MDTDKTSYWVSCKEEGGVVGILYPLCRKIAFLVYKCKNLKKEEEYIHLIFFCKFVDLLGFMTWRIQYVTVEKSTMGKIRIK